LKKTPEVKQASKPVTPVPMNIQFVIDKAKLRPQQSQNVLEMSILPKISKD